MLEARSFSQADETREFGHGRVEVLKVGGSAVTRTTFQPGWKWSNDVKPIVGTEQCMLDHLGYVVSGRLHVRLSDGTEGEAGPGDIFAISPGHDAWVVGDEDCVLLDWAGDTNYAKPQS